MSKKWAIIGLISTFTVMALRATATNTKGTNMNRNKPDIEKPQGVSFAVFNMNPLNIKPRRDSTKIIRRTYPGEITHQQAKHMMFEDWESGTAAAFIHVWRYLNGKVTGNAYPEGTKLNTIERIVRTWAPVTDGNDTEEYISFVVKRTGLYRDTILNFEEREMTALVATMAVREDNKAAKFLTDEVLEHGWHIANEFLQAKQTV
jgi:hypothetical protein